MQDICTDISFSIPYSRQSFRQKNPEVWRRADMAKSLFCPLPTPTARQTSLTEIFPPSTFIYKYCPVFL